MKLLWLLFLLFLCIPVSGHTYYTNKYNPTPEYIAPSNGTLMGNIRCGYNTFTRDIYVNGTPYSIMPDGTFEIELPPGDYDIFLPDGNGGQSEYSSCIIRAGEISRPMNELKGHAVSQSNGCTTIPGHSALIRCGRCCMCYVWIPDRICCESSGCQVIDTPMDVMNC